VRKRRAETTAFSPSSVFERRFGIYAQKMCIRLVDGKSTHFFLSLSKLKPKEKPMLPNYKIINLKVV